MLSVKPYLHMDMYCIYNTYMLVYYVYIFKIIVFLFYVFLFYLTFIELYLIFLIKVSIHSKLLLNWIQEMD